MNKIRNMMFSVSVMVIIILYIIYSENIIQAVSSSVNICLYIMIPSMYGFMIISSLLIKTEIYQVIGKPFGLVSKYLFGIPSNLFSVFLISCIAGYPVGIKMIYSLYEKNEIDRETAEYMSCFCFSSGPAFILGTVSAKLFAEKTIGMTIFLSVTAANIITAVVMRFILGYRNISRKHKPTDIKLTSSALTESIENSAKSMLSICAMIIGFSVFLSIAESSGILNITADIISKLTGCDKNITINIIYAFSEISRISEFPAGNYLLIPIISSLLSFGGICVLVQIISMSDGKIPVYKFIFSRFLSAVFSGIICKFIIERTDICISVSAFAESKIYNHEYSVLPSIFLLIMTIILLKEINPQDRKNCKK